MGPNDLCIQRQGRINISLSTCSHSYKCPYQYKVDEGTRSQSLKLLILGKATTKAPIIKGSSQLPSPPITKMSMCRKYEQKCTFGTLLKAVAMMDKLH